MNKWLSRKFLSMIGIVLGAGAMCWFGKLDGLALSGIVLGAYGTFAGADAAITRKAIGNAGVE